MLKPFYINPENFLGTKSKKINIDNLEKKINNTKDFFQKNHTNTKESNVVISNFLKELFYKNNYEISEKDGFYDQKGELDLAIKDITKENPKNEIIIKLKKPNDKEMVTRDNFYKKSFYQAVYYYLSDKKNNDGISDIKFLIITDNIKWFFIRTDDLEDALFDKVNISQKEVFFDLDNEKTKEAYSRIETYLNSIIEKTTNETSIFDINSNVELPFTFFHLKDIVSTNDNQKLELFIKFLSDSYLFDKVDMVEKNSLNQKFYHELLYIIGLKEVKQNNITTLELLENDFSFIPLIKQYFENNNIKLNKEEFKEKSIELSLLWINRIIFIKLFSSVLQNYKLINKPILDTLLDNKKSIFISMNHLFFDVLSVPKDERLQHAEFKNIPYINNSLFEKEEMELEYMELKDIFYNANATIYHEYKKDKFKKLSNIDIKYNNVLNVLEYLIHFLNSYNIAVDERFSDNSNEDLINASVLGMIFEKINGYKDGSFYTPSYITEFMSKQTIKCVIIDKFNENNFKSKTIDALRKEIYLDEREDEAKRIFDSIKLCDPAVGSGHFLVSSLNAMLFYKAKLGLYENIKTNQLEIVDDTIYINNIPEYSVDVKGKVSSVQAIYEEIYFSKQDIINNSIYAVDINQKSVNISRLRLWIELLKHTHLTKHSNYEELELLPNIDINIKQGNSLISKYPLDYIFSKNVSNKEFFTCYKDLTNQYKVCKNKKEKVKLKNSIEAIKNAFIPDNTDNSFEWRYEFPEILDSDGSYLGFDLIIGNPPYILEDDNKDAFSGLHSSPYYQGKTDIWHIFTGRTIELVKETGYISFIAKNQWMASQSASKMRKAIYRNTSIKGIIDFGANMIFKGASQQTMIFLLKKDFNNSEHNIKYIKFNEVLEDKEIENIINTKKVIKSIDSGIKTITKAFDEKDNLTFASYEEEKIISKIERKKNFEFDDKTEIIQGIIGGKDEYFIVNKTSLSSFTQNKQEHIKMFHTSTSRYYTEDTNEYLIYLSKNKLININLKQDYPNFYKKLLPFKKNLENRREVVKQSIRWYNLWWARNENFFKKGEKIVWAKRTNGRKFTYTEDDFYGSANLFFIKSNRVNLKFITALLNSKLMFFYMKKRLKHTGDLLQIDKNQFLKIPIYLDNKKIKDIVSIVDKITDAKKVCKATSKFEDELDSLIYKMYNISKDEICIIENNINNV
jgi:hypothetical protein